ncbi:hypothetical protein [Neptunicoccus cionae]|uniref:C2H2-type domain-containing protein n=1 Tax=Neptunicoccus cionae TaxID=2035344 RepID=A0A916QXS4_9RHOB|nr:hypothetical protein [Amylibacter cionae]GGA19335.1 hypothetical protein GCM10011498_20270 [Amylibacter cionae]
MSDMKNKLKPTHKEDLSEALEFVKVLRPSNHRFERSCLEDCRLRFEAGDSLALHEAIIHCERGAVPLPIWLSTALKEFLVDGLTDGVKGRKGRSNSPFGLSAKAFKQELHYRLVERILGASLGVELAHFVSRAVGMDVKSNLGSLPSGLREKLADSASKIRLKQFVHTKAAAYEIASLFLRGTFAQAEPRTIRSSHKAFKKKMQECDCLQNNNVSFFSETDPETLDAFGLQIELSETELYAWEAGQDLINFSQSMGVGHKPEVLPCKRCGELTEKFDSEEQSLVCDDCVALAE